MQMGIPMQSSSRQSSAGSVLSIALVLFAFELAGSSSAIAIPAFARKYSLPCSACHEAWPKLNTFGQTFKDNGFQLMNDRDSPIWQNPSYWPVSFRITPNFHRESTNRVAIDQAGGAEQKVTSQGFDLSGLDILTEGTLYKNISFQMIPAAENDGSFHFESAWVRFDNLAKSPWLNVKVGKFELDSITSGGAPVVGRGNKSFHREGAFGLFYLKKLDFTLYYQHGWDSAFFGTSAPTGGTPLP